MSQFVEECRSEWKRIGVPDPVADEMAAELAADLQQAETEGASAEDVLGSSHVDPRTFAAAWAAERGVVPGPAPRVAGRPGRLRIALALGTFALVGLVGIVLVILASPSASARLAFAGPAEPPPGGAIWVRPHAAPAPVVVSPDGTTIAVVPRRPGARVVLLDLDESGVDTRTIGSVLLTAGLGGVLALSLFWLWLARRPAEYV